MRNRVIATAGVILSSVLACAPGNLAAQGLPVKQGRPVVATVNADSISLDEFVIELGTAADRARLQQGLGSAKELELLDRMIRIKLVSQEAATMGLDEIPEVQKQVEVQSRVIMREILMERLVKDVKANPATAETIYKDLVREWRTASLLFQNEEAATRARKEITAGATFDAVAAKSVAAKTARTEGDDSYHPKKDYLPPIAEALAKLQPGQVSPVIRLQAGFVIVKVVDIRYPENKEARAQAQRGALNAKQLESLKAQEAALRRQYVVVDKAVFKGINYEADKPGIDALLKDKRVVAQIKGGDSVTVGDLTDYLRMQSFHGDRAASRKRMNATKEDALEATIERRLLNAEARRLGIDKSAAYRDRVRAYQDSLVFDRFVQKVILPGNRMKDEEVKRYYDTHLKEFSSPEMVKMRSLAFTRRSAAEDAMRKLREGAEYRWMVANAAGQVGKDAPGLLTFDGRPVLIDSMPQGVQKAIAGTKAGDLRLYASPEGHVYVLAIQEKVPPTPRPFNEVKEDVSKKLFADKIDKSLADYTSKLRALSKTEVYLKKAS